MAAIISGFTAGIGVRLGLGQPAFLSRDWFNQLAISTGLGAGMGGVTAEIKGGSFWQGAAQGAAWSAAGYVVSSIFNKDEGQKEEDTLWYKFKHKMNNTLTVAGGALEGAWDGVKNIGRTAVRHGIYAVNAVGNTIQTASFGMIEYQNAEIPKWADSSSFINKYGKIGNISQGFAHAGLIAAYSAGALALWEAAGGATMNFSIEASTQNPLIFHVQYGVNGAWQHAVGGLGNMWTIAGNGAGLQITGVPVLFPNAVMLGGSAICCSSAAGGAFLRGWGF